MINGVAAATTEPIQNARHADFIPLETAGAVVISWFSDVAGEIDLITPDLSGNAPLNPVTGLVIPQETYVVTANTPGQHIVQHRVPRSRLRWRPSAAPWTARIEMISS